MVYGGLGDDVITGGAGLDEIYGGGGNDSYDEMRLYARDAGFPFPYLYDGENQKVTAPLSSPNRRNDGASCAGGNPNAVLNQGTRASQATTPKPANSMTADSAIIFGICPRR